MLMLSLDSSVLANNLPEKNLTEMTYFVSNKK